MHVTIKDAEKVPGLTVRVVDGGNVEIEVGKIERVDTVRAKLLQAAGAACDDFMASTFHSATDSLHAASAAFSAATGLR